MMSRRQMLMLLTEEEEQGLPSEYLQVEYLQGIPRQQYIDTGVVAESISDFHLELKWRLSNSGSHVNYTPIFGDYIAEAYEATRMILTTTNDTSIYANCKSQAQGAKTLTNIALDTDHILSMEKGSATVDGTTTTLTTTKGTDNNNSIALCSNGVKAVVQTFASYSMRIYYFRVYSGLTPVRDMIPCIRISDSKPGMYDLVGRQFYTNAGTGEFLTGYVVDGLVFKLDGIDKGSDSTKWIDRIGNKEITLTNCSFTTDGVDFSASGAIGLLDGTSVGVTPANGTIEICASASSNMKVMVCCYFRGENSSIRLYESGSASKFDMSNNNNDVSFTHGISEFTKMTISENQLRGYINGTAMTATTGRTWTASITSPCIILGSSNKTVANRFAGTMHSVRVYNRQLTANEMLHNQKVDNDRYNLGLTI